MPDKALKSVLFPVLGLPIRATLAGRKLAPRIDAEDPVTVIPRSANAGRRPR